MIAGIVGIFIAFLIVFLVLFFGKRKPDQKIALQLNNYLTLQGFALLDTKDHIYKEIANTCKITKYPTYIEQVYRRMGDDYVICWLADFNGSTNHIVAAFPKDKNIGTWIMLLIPGISGVSGKFIRKSFELTLSSNFTRMELKVLGQLNMEGDLYVKKGEAIPHLKNEFINLLPQCGKIVVRSGGSVVLLERISVTRTETWEEEARELLQITKLLSSHI